MGAVFDFWNAAESQIIAGADPVSTWNTMVTDVQTAPWAAEHRDGGAGTPPAPPSHPARDTVRSTRRNR